jgi:hypothetical protein
VRNIKATKKQKRMIGVAGIVAEAIWLGDEPCEIDPDDIVTSASDLEMIGRCSLSQFASAIDQVAAFLKRDTGVLWPSLLQTARTLIIESRGPFFWGRPRAGVRKATGRPFTVPSPTPPRMT